MRHEIEWYRAMHDAEKEGASGSVYRAIRWAPEKSKYLLIANLYNLDKGTNDRMEIEFDNPGVLTGALVMLAGNGSVDLESRGTVTREHEAWDYSQAQPHDANPSKNIMMGVVRVSLALENKTLAPFESTVQVTDGSGMTP